MYTYGYIHAYINIYMYHIIYIVTIGLRALKTEKCLEAAEVGDGGCVFDRI
jgi:hypothetical protein